MPGKVALVTGAGSGIGAACASAFAAAGASVLATDLDPAAAAATAATIRQAGGAADSMALDIADYDQAVAAVARAEQLYGGLHVLLHAALWFAPPHKVADIPLAVWRRNSLVNFDGSFYVCKAAIPAMIRAGGGSVVLISSNYAHVAAEGGWAPYDTVKTALLMLAKSIAVDHGADGIRANTLSPGAVETRRLLELYDGDLAAARRDAGPRHLLNRTARPEEIAAGAVFLASDESSFMTGTDLLLDGGMTAR